MNSLHTYHSGTHTETPTLPSRYGSILLHWDAPEHDPFELGPRATIVTIILLITIIAWALYTNSPIMAVTFILIGMTGYLALGHEPSIIPFYLTNKGLVAGKEFYEYESIESFHLYSEPPFDNLLSIKTNGSLVSHVHIPITTLPVEELRSTLIEFVPEDKHEPGLVDTLEKFLHI